MPLFDEILCMAKTLCRRETFYVQALSEPTDIYQTLYLRCGLVGCVPGIVFDGEKFIEELREITKSAEAECRNSSMKTLLYMFRGGTIEDRKTSSSASSTFYCIQPEDDLRRKAVRSFLLPATSFFIQETLREKLAGMRGGDGQAFQFEDISAALRKGGWWGRQYFSPCHKIACGANLRHTTCLIKPLLENANILVRASHSYPILDFAIANNIWFDATVHESTHKISLSDVATLMVRHLEFADIQDGVLRMRSGAPEQIYLGLIRNAPTSGTWRLDKELPSTYESLNMNADQIERVFRSVVLNTAQWAPTSSF